MRISKEDVEKRLNDPRNFFSPNYVDPRSKVVPEASPESKGPSGESKDENSPSDKQADDLVARALSKANPYEVRGRARTLQGQTDVQVAIGTTSLLLGPGTSGNLYGLSEEQSRAYRDGLGSLNQTGTVTNPTRYKKIALVREALAEKAAERLSSALDSLDEDKIETCSASKLSAIAKDMAVVMDKVTKDNSRPESIHFHVFKPELKSLGDYTTVQLSSPIVVNPIEGGGAD